MLPCEGIERLFVLPLRLIINRNLKMKVFKKLQFSLVASLSMILVQHSHAAPVCPFPLVNTNTAHLLAQDQNLMRAMELVNRSIDVYFTADGHFMHRFYNPDTKTHTEEKASVWMYSASIEAVNAILRALQLQKDQGNEVLFDQYYDQYVQLLDKLHDHAAYYLGTFRLTSFTQTRDWTVYAVDRAAQKGAANVTGVLNVYDDQMWLIRELIEAYHLTGKEAYLNEAEYLTAYVLDGWDCTLNDQGEENGGIPWGPGYVTKHACSNGPMISPLVWLHEIYKNKTDFVEHNYIDVRDRKTRHSKMVPKSSFYLDFAKRIYSWQKEHLLNENGVYDDMMGDCYPDCTIAYEVVNGKKYRKNTQLLRAVGTAFSYNSGTMIAGAADLYRATKSEVYLEDGKRLADASFQYFAKLGSQIPGHYTYASDGFNNWFNVVLLKGFFHIQPLYRNAGVFMDSFQQNLDYGYRHFLRSGFLPADLLGGWHADQNKNNIEGMFMFAYATQYALLSQYHTVNRK